MDLLTELNRAMAYIEANITDEEALLMVASVTSYSPYHFQRIFNYITDMPISEYIRRRKMSLAAMELQSDTIKFICLTNRNLSNSREKNLLNLRIISPFSCLV